MKYTSLREVKFANQQRILAKALVLMTKEERQAMRAWAEGEAARESKPAISSIGL